MKALLKLLPITLLVSCSQTIAAPERTTQTVWNNLLVKKFMRIHKDGFEYVKNDPALPNVLLYGDSISIHYTKYVRAYLADKANVHRLHTNGGSSHGFIKNMNLLHSSMQDKSLADPWTFDWDVIHFNVGLHDLKYLHQGKLDLEQGKQVSTIKGYKNRLIHIIEYLKANFPNAKLIFATSTPVPENAKGRIAGDSAKYNEAALEVLKAYPEVAVNDLYGFTKDKQQEWWMRPGDVHYAANGRKAQGEQVAKVITANSSKIN